MDTSTSLDYSIFKNKIGRKDILKLTFVQLVIANLYALIELNMKKYVYQIT